MTERSKRRRKGDSSIPRWGWIPIVALLLIIAGTTLHIKGSFKSLPPLSSFLPQKEATSFYQKTPAIVGEISSIRRAFARHALLYAEMWNFRASGEETLAVVRSIEILRQKSDTRDAAQRIPELMRQVRNCGPRSSELKPAHNCLIDAVLALEEISLISAWDPDETSLNTGSRIMQRFRELDHSLKRFQMLSPISGQ